MIQILVLLLFAFGSVAHAVPTPVMVAREVAGNAVQPAVVGVEADGTVHALDAEGTWWRWRAVGAAQAFVKGKLHAPLGMTPVADGWLIADTGGRRIVLADYTGKIQRVWPLPALPCPEGEEHPDCRVEPEPVAVVLAGKRLFWSDRAAQRLCWLDRDSGRLEGCVGGLGRMEAQFHYPYQIAVDPDRYLYVVDVLNARVQVFDDGGRFFLQIGRFGLGEGELYRPNGIALDGPRGLVFVSDGYFGTISVFYQGKLLGRLRDGNGKVVRLDSPTGLAYRDGELIVAETGASRIVRLRLRFEDRPVPETPRRPKAARKDCLICHLEFATDAPPDVSGPDELGQLPVAHLHMCYSCHSGPVIDSRLIIRAGAQHPTLYDPETKKQKYVWPRKDELPDDFPITEEHQLTCTSCHTPHNDADNPETLYEHHRNAWLRVLNDDGRLCERCHESKAKGARETSPRRRGVNHPLGIRLRPPPRKGAAGYPGDPDLTHGLPETLRRRGGALGPDDDLICQSCHQIHGGLSDDLLLLGDDRGQLCAQCHKRQFSRSKKEARRKGVHPVNVKPEEKIVIDGKRLRWVTCTTCHPVHDGKLATPMLKKPAEKLCQDCHARQHAKDQDEARKKGVHPVNVALDEPVKLAGRKIKRLTCLSCHAVHRGRPNTPALVADHRGGQLCRACHEDNLPVVGSDHDLRVTAKDSRNRFDESPRQVGVCGSCHTLHRGKGKWPYLYAARIVGHPEKPAGEGDTTRFKRDQLCLNCHQDHPRAIARDKVVAWFSHPARQIVLHSDKNTMPLLDAKEQDADFGAIGCATCHDPHVWTPKHRKATTPPLAQNHDNLEGDPHNSFLRVLQPEKTFCISCHGMEVREKYKYFHDHFVRGMVDYLE